MGCEDQNRLRRCKCLERNQTRMDVAIQKFDIMSDTVFHVVYTHPEYGCYIEDYLVQIMYDNCPEDMEEDEYEFEKWSDVWAQICYAISPLNGPWEIEITTDVVIVDEGKPIGYRFSLQKRLEILAEKLGKELDMDELTYRYTNIR